MGTADWGVMGTAVWGGMRTVDLEVWGLLIWEVRGLVFERYGVC